MSINDVTERVVWGSSSAVSSGVAAAEAVDVTLHTRMVARLAMGTALCVGAVAVGGALAVDAIDAGAVYIGTWIVAVGGWVATKLIGALSGDRLVRALGFGRATVNDRLFPLSYQLVLIGAALLLPLTIHLVPSLILGQRAFEPWVIMSLVLVGHVHGILAFLLARRAGARARGEEVQSMLGVYGLTVAFSAVPGAFLFFLPVIAVALTGLAFLPLMAIADGFVAHERAQRLARAAAA